MSATARINVLDLFSGIGGFSLGLERAGMRTVAFCEIEPYCRAVLAKHWPSVPIYDDVRTLTAERLHADGISVDLICGGFPCQDISNAGKRAGIEGARSGLWSEYARIIGEVRPRYVIVENVAALLGRGLERVLGDLAALGFDAEWHCIRACRAGLPHNRDRIWIIAYSDGERLQGRRAVRPLIRAEAFPVSAVRHEVPARFITHGDDGLPRCVVRTQHASRAIGNAVVPQIPEIIGRAIMTAIVSEGGARLGSVESRPVISICGGAEPLTRTVTTDQLPQNNPGVATGSLRGADGRTRGRLTCRCSDRPADQFNPRLDAAATAPAGLGIAECNALHRDDKSGEGFHVHRKVFRVPDAAKAGARGP